MDVARIVLSGMWLQGVDYGSAGSTKWLTIFVGLVALGMVVQAIAVIVMAVGVAKMGKRALDIAEELQGKMLPLIATSQDMIHDAAPKVKVITENLAETSHLVRSKARDLDATMSDANAKTRAQVARVDGMVSSVLDTTSDAAQMLQRAIKVPVREFTGLVNGLKAGLDVLLGRDKDGRISAPEDRQPDR